MDSERVLVTYNTHSGLFSYFIFELPDRNYVLYNDSSTYAVEVDGFQFNAGRSRSIAIESARNIWTTLAEYDHWYLVENDNIEIEGKNYMFIKEEKVFVNATIVTIPVNDP